MLSREPRAVVQPLQQTDALGPGTYFKAQRRPQPSESPAPFGSLQPRETLPLAHKPSPGPAAYTAQLPKPQVIAKGPSSSAPRFTDPPVVTPPASKYNVATKLKGQKNPERRKTASAKAAASKAKPQIVGKSLATGATMGAGGAHESAKITYKRQPTAAAIPTRHEIYGYNVEPNHTVSKVQPTQDQIIQFTLGQKSADGPAAVPMQPQPSKGPRGIDWSKQSAVRVGVPLQPALLTTPPPTAYDTFGLTYQGGATQARPHTSAGLAQPPATSAFKSKTQRQCLPGMSKSHVPSPLAYTLPSTFERRLSGPSSAFASTTDRFPDPKTEAPAPGTYEDPRSALPMTRPHTMASSAPFLQTSARFREDDDIRHTPGPGAYTPATEIQTALPGHRPAFNSTGRRTQIFTPAVTDVQVEESARNAFEQDERMPRQAGGVVLPPRAATADPAPFGSRTSRFGDKVEATAAAPPLASELLSEAEQKPATAPAKGSGAKKAATPFLSTTQRFDYSRSKPVADTPAPNVYAPEKAIIGAKPKPPQISTSKTPRFTEKSNGVPPPTKYALPPSVVDSLYKPTHNVTLHGSSSSATESKAAKTTQQADEKAKPKLAVLAVSL